MARAAVRFVTKCEEDKARMTRNIIAGLPGAEEGYTLTQFRKHLELSKEINKPSLPENLAFFLKAIIQLPKKVGVRRPVHPADPPPPILALRPFVPPFELISGRLVP